MENPKWRDVVTCKSKYSKFQAIRWVYTDGTIVDAIYRWTSSESISRTYIKGEVSLRDTVESQGLEVCAP